MTISTSFEVAVVPGAVGSARCCMESSLVIAAITGPVVFSTGGNAVLHCRVGKPSGHELAECDLLRGRLEAILRHAVDLKSLVNRRIQVGIELLQFDEHIHAAALNAAVLACLQAAVPMKYTPIAVSIENSLSVYSNIVYGRHIAHFGPVRPLLCKETDETEARRLIELIRTCISDYHKHRLPQPE